MEIRFEIDPDGLTVGDMLMLEDVPDSKRPVHAVVEMLTRFMVDSNGAPMPREAATAEISKLKMPDLLKVSSRFAEAVREKAIPPTTGGG